MSDGAPTNDPTGDSAEHADDRADEATERWIARFEQASLPGKAALLGGTAVRFAANLIDRTLDRAATTVADAEHAFRRELDPTMEDAKILDEWDERRDDPNGERDRPR